MTDTFEYKDKDYRYFDLGDVLISKYEQIVMVNVVDNLYEKTFQYTNCSSTEAVFLRNKFLPSQQYPAVSAKGVHLTLMNSFFEKIVNDETVFSTLTKKFKYEVLTKLWIFHLVSANLIPVSSLFTPEWIPSDVTKEFSKFSSVSDLFKSVLELIDTCNKVSFDKTETRLICVLIVLDSLRMFRKILKPKFDFLRMKKILLNHQKELYQEEAESRFREFERVIKDVSRLVWQFDAHLCIFSFFDEFIPDYRLDIYNAFLVPTPSYRTHSQLPVPKALRIEASSPRSLDRSHSHLRHSSSES